MFEVFGVLAWAGIVLSVVVTPLGLATRSWWRMLIAAGGSLIVTFVSFGLWTFALLLACLQIAAALALRWSAGWRGWALLLATGLGVWALAAPVQFMLESPRPVLALIAFAAVALGFALTVVGPERLRGRPFPGPARR